MSRVWSIRHPGTLSGRPDRDVYGRCELCVSIGIPVQPPFCPASTFLALLTGRVLTLPVPDGREFHREVTRPTGELPRGDSVIWREGKR